MCQPKIIWDKSNRFLGLECDRKNYVGRSKYGPKSSLIVLTKLCRKLFCERNFKLIAMSHEQLFFKQIVSKTNNVFLTRNLSPSKQVHLS